jgi:cytochrome b561
LPARTPDWQRRAYRATHGVFYALFFLVPLLGWAYTSAVGVPVVWFGVLPLPDFVPRDKAFGEEVLKPLHEAGSYLLAAIVVVHVAAALKHELVDRDHLLARMWPHWPGRRRT